MRDSPIASFSKSDLRTKKVVDCARREPVEIRLGSAEGSLVLLSRELFSARTEVQHLAELFLRMIVELQRPDPSPVVLGDVAFVVGWDQPERERFVAGFAEALAESLRTDDPIPARGFVELMANAGRRVHRAELSGDLSGLSDADEVSLRARLG